MNFVQKLTNEDGGFSLVPSISQSSIRNTFCGVTIISLLDKLEVINHSKVKQYINSLRTESGGYCFSDTIFRKSNLFSTFYALSSLNQLEHGIQGEGDTRKYLLSLQNDDGSFSKQIGGESNVEYTYFALASLDIINDLHFSAKNKNINYLQDQLLKTQGLSETAWIVLALDILGDKNNNPAIRDYLLLRQDEDGSFREMEEKSLGYTYYAIQALVCLI